MKSRAKKLSTTEIKFKPKLSAILLKSKILMFVKEQGEGGISVEEIDKALFKEEHYIPIRTLQRRLGEMQPELIIAKGSARATRYYLSTPEDIAAYKAAIAEAKDPRSKKASGKAADHNQQYLDKYEPQLSSYLSPKEKQSLAVIGKTTDLRQQAGTFIKRILPRFLTDLAFNSCRLEGHPLSFTDVQQIMNGLEPGDKMVYETQMILNHQQAIEFIVAEAEHGLNSHILTNLHALLSDNLLPDPAMHGRVRSEPLNQKFSTFQPSVDPLFIDIELDMKLAKAAQIEDPFERSFFLWVHLSYLQPFERFNNEVSRLAMNIPFIQNNISPLSFVAVPVELYNEALDVLYDSNYVDPLKKIFITAYKRSAQLYALSQQSPDDPALFKIKYRDQLGKLVSQIIISAFTSEQASTLIKEKSLDIEEADRLKFIDYVNTELQSLHGGNMRRFSIQPLEFERWKALNKTMPDSSG